MDYPPTPTQIIDAVDALLARHRETGDAFYRTAAVELIAGVLRAAEETGETAGRAMARAEEEGDDDGDGRDPAEDYEPDISDVGWDPWMGTYTDDC